MGGTPREPIVFIMKLYSIRRVQVIPVGIERVFSFFSDPENLSRLTPENLGFQIMTQRPIEMKTGALIDYTIRLFGIRTRWTTLISSYDPPHSFVDEMVRGPYSFWHHTHDFRELDGGTEITDMVRYVIPFGLAGRLTHTLFVRRQLGEIFDYRYNAINNIFRDDNKSHIATASQT